MTPDPRLIDVFDSAGEPYRKAFSTFLAHTDQKANAMVWLEREIEALPRRDTFIDAGAGNGKLTRSCRNVSRRRSRSSRTPSPRADLIAACLDATALGKPSPRAEPATPGDFVLCSHVFYYIDRSEWAATLRRLSGWLAPGGVLAIASPAPRNRPHADAPSLHGPAVRPAGPPPRASPGSPRTSSTSDTIWSSAHHDECPSIRLTRSPSSVLNLIPLPSPCAEAVREYVARHFAQPMDDIASRHQASLRPSRRGSMN